MSGLFVRCQKPPAQIPFWAAIAPSSCSANNRTWILSIAGWSNNHVRLGRIPDNRHRLTEIVVHLTSFGIFKVKAKLKKPKNNLKYVVYRMLTFH
ncbi:MAG: hypothetical protein WCJ49_08800 [Deltaproteobacteria bacterium]